MADFIPPVGWKLYSNEAHQSTYVIPGHAVDRPYLAIFSRVVAAVSGKGPNVPEYRVRILRGYKDSLGNLVPTRKSADIKFRWPLESSDPAEMKTIVGIIGTICSNVDFQDDAVVEQLVPRLQQ